MISKMEQLNQSEIRSEDQQEDLEGQICDMESTFRIFFLILFIIDPGSICYESDQIEEER